MCRKRHWFKDELNDDIDGMSFEVECESDGKKTIVSVTTRLMLSVETKDVEGGDDEARDHR